MFDPLAYPPRARARCQGESSQIPRSTDTQMLPEFFNSRNRSKMPSIFKDYCDFMLNTYKLQPSEYLTFNACRRNLAGVVCAIMRDHVFLEQWVNPKTRPATLIPPFTGHFRVILDTPRGLQSLHSDTRPSPKDASAAMNGAANTGPSAMPGSSKLRSNIYQATAKASREVSSSEAKGLANGSSHPGPRGVSFSCDTCGVDCTPVRYHSLKNKDYVFCPPCYLDGLFPLSMFSGDFVKLTAPQSASAHRVNGNCDNGWSDQEILLLLEGVEMYDYDWSLTEEHIGTLSAQQCIRNVVAFLAGVVGPGVAAEAAKSVFHELTDGDKDKKDGEAEKTDGADKANDEKVDEAIESTDLEQKPESHAELKPTSSKDIGGSDDGMAVDAIDVVRAAHLALQTSAKVARALADAEATSVRTVLAQLIKLALSRLELKMGQFEEMETTLKEERRALEAQRLVLASRHAGMYRTLESVRSELAKNAGVPQSDGAVAAALAQGVG
ncbi:hypothetical protein DFH11DRAFT_1842891 [Phellopilus nigrolimitatus]|nr:hypothetical protein DFH11DRAFT_1842891 [Phellopilus nigrolimitatus]